MVTQAFELECKSYDRKEDGGEKKYTEKMNNCYGHTTDNEINTDDGDEMNQSSKKKRRRDENRKQQRKEGKSYRKRTLDYSNYKKVSHSRTPLNTIELCTES